MNFGLNEILENSTFKKASRNKYSFPKSQRFPKIKLNNTIDYYEKPSTITKRTCSFGFGHKTDISKSPATITPSPLNYQVSLEQYRKPGISFGLGRDQTKSGGIFSKNNLGNPSPQKYNVSCSGAKYKNYGNAVLTSRTKQDSFLKDNHNPEPGTYELNDTYLSTIKSSKGSAFGSSKRFSPIKKDSSIGPMTYDYKTMKDLGLTTKFSFNHAKRKTYALEAIQKSLSPGPKYYID